MPLPDVRTLDPEERAAIRTDARRLLAHFRGNATGRTRERARLIVAGARLTAAQIDRSGAAAAVDDDGETFRARLDWADVAGARCGCMPFRRKGTCAHLVALLEASLAALDESAAVAPVAAGAPQWLQRLEAMTGAIEGRENTSPDPWRAPTPADFDVRYVLRFAERRGEVGARLECQVRRRGEAARWVAIPFAGADAGDVDLPLLGADHARVAAVATGAPEASWIQDPTHRAVSLATVTRAMARPLLEAALEAAPLVLAPEGEAASKGEPTALGLELDRRVTLELEADDESRPIWTIRAWLSIDGAQRVPASSIVRVSSDGVCVLAEPARVVLLPEGDASAVAAEFARAPLEIPRREAPSLSAIGGAATLVGDELAEIARPPRPTPSLRADSPLEVEGDVRVSCHISFDYGGTLVRLGDRTRVIPALDGRSIPRQPSFEAAALRRFQELGGRPTAENRGPDATVSGGRFLGLVGALVDEGWHVIAKDQLVRGMSGIDVSITSGVDWFDLVGGVKFDGEEIPFPKALEAAQGARGFIELGDGSRGMLPERWLQRWRLAALGAEQDDALRFDRTQSWILSTLADQREAEVDDPFRALREKIATLGAPGPVEPPATFMGELRPYQREGLGWLRMLDEVGLCGCLADDMGLGKTVQVLAYVLARAREANGRHALVVAPRSLVFNWLHEAGRFAPSISTVDFTGPQRWERFEAAPPGSLLVTTYGALRRDAERLAETELDLVILDEAQAIKSRRSQTTTAARALRARRRVTLTGTPVENHLGEIWSQLDFLNPGMLGAHTAFERLGAPRSRHGLGDEGRALLARALRPFLLRRTKDAVLDDLPPKTEQVLRAPMTGAQETIYAELARYFRSELVKSKGQKRKERLEDFGKAQMHVLAALTRLRQAACHPGLVDPSLLAESSGKLDAVLPMLEEIVEAGGKALVFSSFTRLLGLVRTRLETARIPYHVLEGKTRDRGAVVERFQTSREGGVFLVSIKAGGAGLNLTAADYVFLLDPWWNPAVEAQAIDRAHRIGRTRPVHVYRVLTEGTVEARVVELQERKSELAAAVLDGAATTLTDLEPDDLAFLLS